MLMFLYYNGGDYIRYGYYNTVYILTDLMNECFDEIRRYRKYEDELYNDYENDRDLGWEKVEIV